MIFQDFYFDSKRNTNFSAMEKSVMLAGQKPLTVYLKEVWEFRSLILTFAYRDLRVQYAQTFLGLLWSVIQPLTGLLIFNFFFQKVIHINLNVPYAVFAFTGIMGWFYFTQLVAQAGTALTSNHELIRKIHFPRLILPLSKVMIGLAEFLISFVLLILLMLITDCNFSYKLIFLPLVIIANIISGLSIGIWLCALTIRFRDLHHIIPFLVGFGIWLTPVFYPSTFVPQDYNWIYFFHPVANVISLYRWIILDTPVNLIQVSVSLVVAMVLFISGLVFFVRNEKFISDYL